MESTRATYDFNNIRIRVSNEVRILQGCYAGYRGQVVRTEGKRTKVRVAGTEVFTEVWLDSRSVVRTD